VTSSPQSLTRAQGLTVSFDVTAAGSLPVFYQWLSNGVAITGATTSALTLSDIQPSYAASYSVAVSNAIGTNISSPATLTVVPGAPGSYAGAVVADGPIAYWPLDDPPGSTNALDIVGSYDGAYSGLEVLGQPGPFPGDTNESAVYFPGAGGIQIPYAAALNPPETFSVECWAEAATNGSGTARVLFSSRTYNPNGSGEGPWFAGYQLLAETNNAWEFTIGQQQLQPVSTLSVDSVVTNAADGAWHYIVGTYDNVTLNLNLYVDGQLVATVAATSDLNWWPNAVDGNFNQTAADEAIGSTSDDDPELAEGNQFYGKVDEMAVYGYALSPTQVASHFARSGNGPAELSIAKFSGQIVVTWSKGQLLEATSLLGPWTTNAAATSPLTNSPGGKTMFYRAVVTNAP
jgi:hypothetical protein